MKKLALILGSFAAGAAGGAGLVVHLYWDDYRREKEFNRLNQAIRRLEAERRIAEIRVLEQTPERTTFRFREIRPDGTPIQERDFTIRGEVLYVDALVVKFERRFVRIGDGLRGRSLYLFERLFGEYQRPADGFRLDQGVPAAYRTRPEPSEFEREIWRDFWKVALDPDYARARGVRVAQGEAVRTRLRPGKYYRLTIENAGGINIYVSNETEPAN